MIISPPRVDFNSAGFTLPEKFIDEAVSDRIRRGVVRLSTGAWFDPEDAGSNRPLEKHGNPNALTLDIGASKLSQGCIAQTCLVEIERFDGPAPAVTAHRTPAFAVRGA